MHKGRYFPARKSLGLRDVFAPNGELFRSFDTHLDAPAGAAEESNLDWAIRKQLCHGHVGVNAIRRLNNDRFIGAAT
jgi:hypothetical protein